MQRLIKPNFLQRRDREIKIGPQPSQLPQCLSLHCALASCGAMYCSWSCLWVCDSGRVGGVRTLLQSARVQCLRLSGRFFQLKRATEIANLASIGHSLSDTPKAVSGKRNRSTGAIRSLSRRKEADDEFSDANLINWVSHSFYACAFL